MLNSKKIGNVTEIQCILEFMKLGYNVLTPYGDCERYDFVVDIKGALYKVQVKTARVSEDNTFISFNCSSKTTKNGKFVNHSYSKKEIDYFMTFYNGIAYLVPVEESASKEKRLRFSPPANGQIKGITFAKEYELESMVNKIVNE